MCGRYGLFHPGSVLANHFDLDEIPDVEERYNIPPGDDQPVVGENPERNERNVQKLRWGLVPEWVDDPNSFDANLINARVETVLDKPSFKKPIRSRRAIVPVSGFYEWDDKTSEPYFFRDPGENPIGLAGIWDRWSDGDQQLFSYAILTRPAAGALEGIHDRMPVVLHPGEYDSWLDRDEEAEGLIEKCLRDRPQLDHYAVSRRVNDPTNDDAHCVEPVD